MLPEANKEVQTDETDIEVTNQTLHDKCGVPSDPCLEIRRVNQQTLTDVTGAIKGSFQQCQAGVLHVTREQNKYNDSKRILLEKSHVSAQSGIGRDS